MDYARIYEQFISSRSLRKPDGYCERHHIVPRCIGGGDAASNLIDLSAEDHYFAHLLLAKIHGGKLASALQLLADVAGKRWRERTQGRRCYAFGQKLAARLKGLAWEGAANPLHNPTVYRWKNYRSGETRSATLLAMSLEFGGSRPHWTNVARANRPSYRGWLLSENEHRHARSEKGYPFEFVNRDGRTFVGTQGEFAAAHGLNLASASRVVRHDSVTRCGWRRKGVSDRPHNFGKDGRPARSRREPTAISNGYTITAESPRGAM